MDAKRQIAALTARGDLGNLKSALVKNFPDGMTVLLYMKAGQNDISVAVGKTNEE